MENNVIRLITETGKEIIYTRCYVYREDYNKEGCIHFKDSEGKHHRIYGGTVIIEEE